MQEAAPNRIHARSFGEIISATWACYRENFATLMIICLLVIVPLRLLSLILFSHNMALPTTDAGNISRLSGNLLSIIVQGAEIILAYSPITIVASAYMFGRRLTRGSIWAMVSPYLSQYALAYILLVVIFVLILVFIVLTAILCPLTLIFLVPVIYFLMTCVPFLPAVIMLEHDHTPRAAIYRAYVLARQRFWQIILFSLIFSIILWVFGFVFSLLAGALLPTLMTNPFIMLLVTLLVQVLVTPLYPIGMTFLYYDVRVRTEELAVAVAQADIDARPDNLPTRKADEPVLRSRDVVNMLVLTVVVVAAALALAQTLTQFSGYLSRNPF